MSNCEKLKDYMAGFMEEESIRFFDAHLETCVACRCEVEKGQIVDRQIGDWIDERDLPDVTLAKAQQLVDDAGASSIHRFFIPKMIIPFAAAAVVALFSVWFFGPSGAISTPHVEFMDSAALSSIDDTGDFDLVVPGNGRLLVKSGADRVALGAHSRATLTPGDGETSTIHLYKGRVVVQAAKRHDNASLTVVAGDYRVTVLGTRFSVVLEPNGGVSVAVSEGEVAVQKDGQAKHIVAAGYLFQSEYARKQSVTELPLGAANSFERLLLKAGDKSIVKSRLDDGQMGPNEPTEKINSPKMRTSVHSPRSQQDKQNVEQNAEQNEKKANGTKAKQHDAFDAARVRKWIVGGQYDRALSALEGHLNRSPQDIDAWLLLANCRRKTKNWEQAIYAYRKVIEVAGPMDGNRARFKMAAIYQDKLGRHGDAVGLLESYLKRDNRFKPHQAEAKFRLARSLRAIGRNEMSEKVLKDIVNNHAGSTAATQARELLAR